MIMQVGVLSFLDQPLARAATRISALTGWKRRGASFLAGIVSASAFAPYHLLPMLAVGFSALIFLLDGAQKHAHPVRTAASIGWWFGFGHFLLGLYWMAFSFLVQAEEFAWMAPFVMLGMPAFLAVFPAAATAFAMAFWRDDWRRILVFSVTFSVLEYARGHILTGLPWNLVGQAFAGTASGAQSSAIWGVYGLSLVGLLLATAPAATVSARAGSQKNAGTVFAIIGCAILFAGGALRIALTNPGFHDDVSVHIVQASIPQREKIDFSLWGQNFNKHLALSADIPASDDRVYVIWPENAAPLLSEVDEALSALENKLPANAVLITGAVRRDQDGQKARYYNSLSVVPQTPKGRLAATYYDKHHLVPFGEYLPLKGFLRAIGLAQLAPFEDGFTPGAGPQTLHAGGPSFAPLICYETIFPSRTYPKSSRPDWLLTVTNDAWFGDSAGPRQHLDQARLRSIETGLPMARAANTGVSALIDARGLYLERLDLYRADAINAALPKPLAPTIYARFGDMVFFSLIILVAFLSFQKGVLQRKLTV